MEDKELTIANVALVDLMQDAFNKGSLFRFQARGFSMLPFIRDGDVITISPFSYYSISIGKAVAFIHPETCSLVIHRLINKRGNYCIAKGDNVSQPDGLISKENMLGYVTRLERRGRVILFGFGLERFLIVLLSRINVFCLLLSVHRIMRNALRRIAE